MNIFTYLDNCNKRRYLFKMIRRESANLRSLIKFKSTIARHEIWRQVYGPQTDLWIEQTDQRIFYYTNKLNSLLR